MISLDQSVVYKKNIDWSSISVAGMLYFALRVFPGAQMKEYAAKLLAALFAGQEPDILPSFVQRAEEVGGSV